MGCQTCPYSKYPKIPAPKVSGGREVVIVGEAPGATEISRKEVFIGPSGQLLDKVLEVTSLPPRNEMHVTNALLCKPPHTKPNLKTATRCCRDRLLEEIEACNPKMIIALGNIAMHSIMDDFNLKITKEQGRVLESPFFPGVPIIPVLHPAAILRAPGDYKLFYGTMHKAGVLYTGGKMPDPGVPNWRVATNPEEADKMVEYLRSNADEIKMVGADIETTGLNPRLDEVLVLGVSYAKNRTLVFPYHLIPKELFKIKELKWIWQNGFFDTQFLRRRGFAAEVHHDTILMSYTLNEHGGIHDLEQLASRYLGAQAYKHKARRKAKDGGGGFGSLEEKDQYERVAYDADYTRQIAVIMLEQIHDNGLLSKLYEDLLIPAVSFLRGVSRNGMYVDMELLEAFRKEYQEALDEVMEQILDLAQPIWRPELYKEQTGAKTAPEIFNPSSPQQLAWLLFDRLGLPTLRGRKRSTNKEVLEHLRGKHPIIDLMLEYRSISKELSTYIIGVKEYIASDGRVHSVYKLHGTKTGRLSSSEPNLQNQPKRKPKVRNIFRAAPGNCLLEVDYKGAELRVLALQSKDVALTECFVQRRDLHTEVSQALHISRIRAKAVNFGIPYGRTEYSLSDEFDISVDEARHYIRGWFDRFPEAEKYLNMCAQAPVKGKSLVTPFGRHRRFGLVTMESLHELQNEAMNFTIQSIASDLTLISAMRMEKELKKIGVKIINLVHDSILFEMEADELLVRKAMEIIEYHMTQVPIDTLYSQVPFEVEFEVGVQWGNLREIHDNSDIREILEGVAV